MTARFIRRWTSMALAGVLLLALLLAAKTSASWASSVPRSSQAPVAAMDQGVGLLFIENVGQFPAEARFQVRNLDRGALWLAEDALWVVQSPLPAADAGGRGAGIALRLSFPGANPHPRLEPFDRLPTTVNYYHGDDPAHWYADVPVWSGVRYVDLYPGLDLEIAGQGSRFAWRLVCRANCQFAPQLRIEGAEKVIQDGDSLRLSTVAGDLVLPLLAAPDAALSGQPAIQRAAPGTFDVTAPFASPVPNPQSPTSNLQSSTPHSPAALPGSLLYSTFLGTEDKDKANGIAVNSDGQVLVTGYTHSPGFPTTPGAYDSSLAGDEDIFVTKLNATGSALVYSTFIGGDETAQGAQMELGYDIAVDGSGAVYVSAATTAADLPTTPGAFDSTGAGDTIAVKLDSAGGLAYSTYLPGTTVNQSAIAVDGAGMIYVAGTTSDPDFPTTEGAFNRTFGYSADFFVLKLNPAGQGQSDLLYSTYVAMGATPSQPGPQEYFGDMVLDANGVVYVVGNTGGEFPTTPGAYDTTFNGTPNAVFFKLDPAGNGAADLLYSTYLGSGGGIAVDSSGRVAIIGYTSAEDFPTTPGAYDTTYNGFGDAFVSQINPAGNGAADLLYSTYLGGSWLDLFGGHPAVAMDDSGDIYVTGSTFSTDFPITPGAFQSTHGLFVTRLRPQGNGADDLIYSASFGGQGPDYSSDLALGQGETVYLTGYTQASDFPTTAGAYDTTFGGGTCGGYPCDDAFVAKLSVQPLDTIAKDSDPLPGTVVDYGQTITYTLGMAVPTMQQLTFYDAVPTETTYLTGSLVAPAEITYDPTTGAFSGTLILAANTLVTVSYAVRVEISGTAESHPPLVNRACVYPSTGSQADCAWSNEVRHPTYLGKVYLPLVLRGYTP